MLPVFVCQTLLLYGRAWKSFNIYANFSWEKSKFAPYYLCTHWICLVLRSNRDTMQMRTTWGKRKTVLTTSFCIHWHDQSWTLGGWQNPRPSHPAVGKNKFEQKFLTIILLNCIWKKNILIFHLLYLLVHVPVQARAFQDEPVLLPLLWKIGFGIFLLPQPALAVTLPEVPAGNPPLTDRRHGAPGWRRQQGSRTDLRSEGGIVSHL